MVMFPFFNTAFLRERSGSANAVKCVETSFPRLTEAHLPYTFKSTVDIILTNSCRILREDS